MTEEDASGPSSLPEADEIPDWHCVHDGDREVVNGQGHAIVEHDSINEQIIGEQVRNALPDVHPGLPLNKYRISINVAQVPLD